MIDLTNPIFHDDDAARKHLEEQRWPHGAECPHCEKRNVTKLEGHKHRKGLYQCNECRAQFTVTVGTVFERSRIPICKWVLATHLMASSKKGVSAKQIQRQLGISYKSAWFVMHRIREAMAPSVRTDAPLGGEGKTVESDETYVGGKGRNAKKGKPVPKKHAVVALIERDGEMRARHLSDVTAKTVREVLVTQARRSSKLSTDDSLLYYWLGREFAEHVSVNHSIDQYVDKERDAHVNNCESFFALLKRGITGSFHSVSEQHLQRYAHEFAFRWNTREARGYDDAERANAIIKASEGKRLTYRRIGEA